MTLAEKIFTLRKKNGLSQDELAQELGVTRQAVYKWESGNASPEIDKLKSLAKLFDVSFDYLLNDDIDGCDTDRDKNEGAQRKLTYRSVFCTGNGQDSQQQAVDHGYIEAQKKKTDMSEAYFARRKKAAEKAMCAAGATEMTFINPRQTTAFFYDDTRKAIGFYYGGAVQLVCPIENLAGFSCHGGNTNVINSHSAMFGVSNVGVGIGSVPTTRVMGDLPIKATLLYHEGESIKEFNLSFDIIQPYLVYEFNGDSSMISMVQNITKSQILENLGKIQIKMDALRDSAPAFVTSEIPDIDADFYNELNVGTAKEYSTYIQNLLNEINGVRYVPPKTNKAPDPAQRIEEKPKTAEESMYKAGRVMLVIMMIVSLIVIYSNDASAGTIYLFAILLGLIPAFIAKKKGKGFMVWWIYGAVLFPIALFHAWVILREEGAVYSTADDEISIPLCIVSGIFPIFGVIYAIVKKRSSPERARACAIAAVIGWVVGLCLVIKAGTMNM